MTIFQSVTCEGFRGSLDRVTLDLFPVGMKKVKRPPVTLIFGENGSGKSTFCDALEFATRGVVSRRFEFGNKLPRQTKNLHGDMAPYVRVARLGEADIHRGASIEAKSQPRGPIEGFSIAPIVLRRSNLDLFWGIQDDIKLHMFWDYFVPEPHGWRTYEEQRKVDSWVSAREELENASLDLRKYIPDGYVYPGQSAAFALPNRDTGMKFLDNALRDIYSTYGPGGTPAAKYQDALIASRRYKDAVQLERKKSRGLDNGQLKPVWTNTAIVQILRDAAPRISDAFKAVTDWSWIDKIEFSFGTTPESGMLAVRILDNRNRSLNPVEVLSEAYLNVLALFVLMEVQFGCFKKGQQPVLILDDIFQSIDAPLRRRALEVLLPRFSDWQLVFTLHDGAWLELLIRLVTSLRGEKPHVVEVQKAHKDASPTILKGATGPLRDLRSLRSMDQVSKPILLAASGRAVESLLDRWTLAHNIIMPRRDRYTIENYLQACKPEFEQCDASSVAQAADVIINAQFLRNRFGAHSNEEAESLSRNDVIDIADKVEELWTSLSCPECGSLFKKKKSGNGKWTPEKTCGC